MFSHWQKARKTLIRLNLSQKAPELEAESSGVSTQSDDSLDEENQEQESVAQEASINNPENQSVSQNQSVVAEPTSVSINSETHAQIEAEVSQQVSTTSTGSNQAAESAEVSSRSETEAQNDAEIVRETVNGVTTYTINDSMGQREISILAQPETTNQARLIHDRGVINRGRNENSFFTHLSMKYQLSMKMKDNEN